MATKLNDVASLELAAATGDADSFEQLVRLWDQDFRRLVWSVVHNHAGLDDVMQQGYERTFRALPEFARRSSLKTWMHSIFYRVALDHAKYEARRSHPRIEEVPAHQLLHQRLGPDAVDERIDLDRLLSECTSVQRAMLMLTSGMGYTYDEVAVILDVSRGTVASTVSRLRSRLGKTGSEGETHE